MERQSLKSRGNREGPSKATHATRFKPPKPAEKFKTSGSLNVQRKGLLVNAVKVLTSQLPDGTRNGGSSSALLNRTASSRRTPAQARLTRQSATSTRPSTNLREEKSKKSNKYIYYQSDPFPHVPERNSCITSTEKSRETKILPKTSQTEQTFGEMEWDFAEVKNSKNTVTSDKLSGPLYVVVDTNIFIANLNKIKLLIQDTSSKFVFYIPWMVHQELDSLSKSRQSVARNARSAILFLKNDAKSSLVIKYQNGVQQRESEKLFHPECGDDKILLACIQLRSHGHRPVLLTDDSNLSNKATASSIPSLNSSNFAKHILDDSLYKTSQQSEFPVESSTAHIPLKTKTPLEALLRTFETVLLHEAKESFGNVWQDVIFVKPRSLSPFWSFYEMFQNFQKHWIAMLGQLGCFKKSNLEVFTSLGGLLSKYDSSTAEIVWEKSSAEEKLSVLQKANFILRSLMGREYAREIQTDLEMLECFEHNLIVSDLLMQTWSETYRFIATHCEWLGVSYKCPMVPLISNEQRYPLETEPSGRLSLHILSSIIHDLAKYFQEVLYSVHVSSLKLSSQSLKGLLATLTDLLSSLSKINQSFDGPSLIKNVTIESLFGYFSDKDNFQLLDNGNKQIQALAFLAKECLSRRQKLS